MRPVDSLRLRYLASYFLFKAGIGALLMQAGWDSLRGIETHRPAIITALAFMPAAFAKPLYSKFANRSDDYLMVPSLTFCALLAAFESASAQGPAGFFFFNHFILWTLIFFTEVCFERRFVALTKGLNSQKIQRLGGFSIAALQAGMIAGPTSLSFLSLNKNGEAYFVVAVPFLAAAGLNWGRKNAQSNPSASACAGTTPLRFNNVLSFALLWPTFAVFNMLIPLVSSSHPGSSYRNIAFLESMLALGAGLTGIFYSKFSNSPSAQKIWLSILVLAAFAMTQTQDIKLLALAIIITSSAYTWLRITARNQIAMQLTSTEAGALFAKANLFSAPLVAFALFLASYEYSVVGTWNMAGVVFIASAISFYLTIKGSDGKN